MCAIWGCHSTVKQRLKYAGIQIHIDRVITKLLFKMWTISCVTYTKSVNRENLNNSLFMTDRTLLWYYHYKITYRQLQLHSSIADSFTLCQWTSVNRNSVLIMYFDLLSPSIYHHKHWQTVALYWGLTTFHILQLMTINIKIKKIHT